ncbi:Platelet-activating factor acetylhydrolase, isoform II [Anaerocolumna jejuensis DSM 15929]|uniref:Platelet-activating factor acetylhydrolase, isoform II n=1 Tax=Anaerocolumna jejuensis DSM 15929 TaxID=1121322 RepID=A0A1M6YP67_9FIRM|nr:hypothetical protein [Anaerocolumna jejuensis]SHL19940.1 Platelet-activating factor acetylhydrolase, isoform II [Anaerocolumna jejuensis DSM 15929]
MPEYIPKPTGEYQVGIYKMDMVDNNRKNTYDIPSGNRKLAMWFFYPAVAEPGEKMHYGIKEDLKKLNIPWSNNFIECYENIAPARGSFSAIIYSHGYGSNLYINTAFCADMASHGFIVVSISHPYEADTVYYQDGSVINFHKPFAKIVDNLSIVEGIRYIGLFLDFISSYKVLAMRQQRIFKNHIREAKDHIATWAQDNSFVLDKLIELNQESDFLLNKRFDFTKGVGLAGHSFGGCAAVDSCYNDKRFCCVLNFDGQVFGACSLQDIERPYMRIGQALSKYTALTPIAYSTAPVYDIALKKVTHMGYTDWMYLPRDNKGMVGKLPNDILFEITTQLTQFFFNKHLCGKENAVFPEISRKYGNVEVLNCYK